MFEPFQQQDFVNELSPRRSQTGSFPGRQSCVEATHTDANNKHKFHVDKVVTMAKPQAAY